MPLGNHLILECHGCDSDLLKDSSKLEEILKKSAVDAKATILHSYFHKFEVGEGITGIIALAESHISVHTWPEHSFMAVDVFMCGDCNPYDSYSSIIKSIKVEKHSVKCFERGIDYENQHKFL
jgi:S-adenosylmethionine decarboxylase